MQGDRPHSALSDLYEAGSSEDSGKSMNKDDGSQDPQVPVRRKCDCEATVMVVDDNEFNIVPLRAMLEGTYAVRTIKAFNGLEAVEHFQRDRQKNCCNTRLRLILMDINMP